MLLLPGRLIASGSFRQRSDSRRQNVRFSHQREYNRAATSPRRYTRERLRLIELNTAESATAMSSRLRDLAVHLDWPAWHCAKHGMGSKWATSGIRVVKNDKTVAHKNCTRHPPNYLISQKISINLL